MASCDHNYHDNRGKKREKELVVLPKLGCLATYIGC
jgi:hypothetical protein